MTLDARTELENRLNGLYHLLCHMESLQQQKDAIYNRHANRYAKYKTPWKGAQFLAVAALWGLLIFFAAFMAYTILLIDDPNADHSSTPDLIYLLPFLVFAAPIPLGLLFGGITTGINNSRIPAINARRRKANEAITQQIEQITAPEIKPLDDQLDKARQEYFEKYHGWFPERYLSSQDVGACWHIVHDHRATTIQDAVNRYLADLHELYMRTTAEKQLAEQQRATRVAIVNGIINASMQSAMISSMRAPVRHYHYHL